MSATTGVARPDVVPPERWAFPVPQRSEGPDGLQVVTYDVPGQYVHSIRLALPVALRREPRELEGIGTIMARCLDEGTLRRSPEEMAGELERHGVGFGASVGESGLTVELDVPKRHLPQALGLLAEMLREPSFPQREVARHVATRLAEIDQERAAPGTRAALEFVRLFYDADERSSRPTGGTPETVGAVTSDAVADYYRSVLGPRGATLVLAGDLSGVDAAGQVARALDGWASPPEPDLPPSVPAFAADAERVVFVDRPGSVQTELHLGCPGVDRHHPDWWMFGLLGFVVGGSPTARVDAVLREEKGFTYGIRSVFRPRRRGGLFLTYGSLRGDATAEGVGLVLDILDGARDGLRPEEVAAGADFIRMTAPARFGTADAVADEAAMLAHDGLTTDFTTRNLAALASADPEAVSAAYREVVRGAWSVVLVGDAERYADAVRGLGRGEVTVVPA